ncbi:MAG: hypothetical protein R2795_02420 [Saprospiraceae bacterium]
MYRQLGGHRYANQIYPEAHAVVNGTIGCASPQVEIDGSSSEMGDNISYHWTTTNGVIVSGEFDNIVTVGQIGAYTLEVTDELSGCTTSTSVTVTGGGVPWR